MNKKYKRLKFGGGQAYNYSTDWMQLTANPLYVMFKRYLTEESGKACKVPIVTWTPLQLWYTRAETLMLQT
jgi:hypothetical protein